MESQNFDASRPSADGPQPCLTFAMARPPVHHGTVWFAEFDAHGRPVSDAAAADVVNRFQRRLSFWRNDWPTPLRRPAAPSEQACVLQVQLLVERPAPLSEPERLEARRLFETGLETLRAKCVALTAGPP